MASTATGSKDEALRQSVDVPMLANASYRASKLSKSTRFDAGRPVPELPLSGSDSEAEVPVYPDSDSSLTMSTHTISPIPPGVSEDSKIMNVMTRFAEFAAKRASNTSFDHSISNDDKEFLAVLDRYPAIAAGFASIAPKTSSSISTIPTDLSAPGWISQSAADCERSDKLKRFRSKKMLDSPYSKPSSSKSAISTPRSTVDLANPSSQCSQTLPIVNSVGPSKSATIKRKSSSLPTGVPKSQKFVSQSYAGHGNSFALLSPDDNEVMDVVPPGQSSDVDGNGCDVSHPQDAPCAEKTRTQVTSSRPSSRPPPFIIAGLTSLRDITILVKTVTNNFKFKNIGSSSARLTVEDGVTYRKVQNLLQSNNIPYNSWQPKEERSFRVVARGLHAETDKQDITDDLTALDHKVRNIHNAKSKTSGKQLNIFFIELEPAPNNKLIYDVKLINHQVVAFEPPNRREDIPRCYRCQEFGHTRSYCSKAVKCAKCGGSHDSKDEAICPAKSQDQYYCINCGSNHAASYRGCPAYLEAINKRKGNAPAKSAPIKRLAQAPLPRDNVWNFNPGHPAHSPNCERQQSDPVNFSVNQDPSQWPILGIPASSSSSSCSLPAAPPFPPCQDSVSAVPVSRQPAQDRLLQQILSLQAAQQKNMHAQSSSMEKLLSRLDQMMALLMQVMGTITSLLPGQPASSPHPHPAVLSAFPVSSRVPNV
ncbi:hypothetical protein ACLKA7_013511 [Drosophila subpalustris]